MYVLAMMPKPCAALVLDLTVTQCAVSHAICKVPIVHKACIRRECNEVPCNQETSHRDRDDSHRRHDPRAQGRIAQRGEARGSRLCLRFFGWWRVQHSERQFYRGTEPKDDGFTTRLVL